MTNIIEPHLHNFIKEKIIPQRPRKLTKFEPTEENAEVVVVVKLNFCLLKGCRKPSSREHRMQMIGWYFFKKGNLIFRCPFETTWVFFFLPLSSIGK